MRFASEIREHILSLPNMVRRPAITERAFWPIAQLDDQDKQRAAFSQILDLEPAF